MVEARMTFQSDSGFFVNLRKLCRHVEKEVVNLQRDISEPSTEQSPANAICQITNKRKEALELRREIQARSDHMHQTGEAFDELLALCDMFCENTRNKLNKIEIYMKQYGYSKPEKKNVEKSSETESQEEEEHVNEELAEDRGSSTPEKVSSDSHSAQMPKTPKLEDFGISQFTLSLFNRGNLQENQEQTAKANFTYQSGSYPDVDTTGVPAIFCHRGVIVTPSVHGGKTRTPGRPDLSVDDLDGTWYRTPAHQRQGRTHMTSTTKGQHIGPQTPPSPELLTPSLNRLAPFTKPGKQEAPPVFCLNSVKTAEEPVFSTPKFSQIGKKPSQSQVKVSDGSASPFFSGGGQKPKEQTTLTCSYPMEFPSTPKSPELTSQVFFHTTKVEMKAKQDSNLRMMGTKSGADNYGVRTLPETPTTPELTYHFDKKKTIFNEVPPQNIEILSEKLFDKTTPDSPVLLSKGMLGRSRTVGYTALWNGQNDELADTPETPKLLSTYKAGY